MSQNIPNLPPRLRKREQLKKLILFGLGGLLIIASVMDFLRDKEPQGSNVSPKPEALAMDSRNQEYDVEEFGGGNDNILYYPTPEISFFEDKFCKGAASSVKCPRRPLHPLFESFAAYGIEVAKPPKKRQILRSETQNRVDW